METLMDDHFVIGELYIEFVKMSCRNKNQLCDFCSSGWVGQVLKKTPKPYPNYDLLPEFH
jgi:hypothetical protein